MRVFILDTMVFVLMALLPFTSMAVTDLPCCPADAKDDSCWEALESGSVAWGVSCAKENELTFNIKTNAKNLTNFLCIVIIIYALPFEINKS
ncbi:MAG: hypothetical protein NT066_00680 [Candidatus Omnitrophica bacterium]|nr:hypothetical protein [Candidatus Omnitrophota bacterium]